MKILKHGNSYREAECKSCGCVYEYCDNDVSTEFRRDLCGNPYSSEYVKCPECGDKNYDLKHWERKI